MLARFGEFLKEVFDSYHVIETFPPWFKGVCVLSAIYFAVFGATFIFFYSRAAALLKTSAALSVLEKKALSGDPQAMLELSFSDSTRSFDILSAVARSTPQDDVRQQAIFALANVKDDRKVPFIGETLLSEKWLVAAACADALGRSGDPRAVPYLLKALDLRIDWVTAQKSAAALGNFQPSPEIARALVTGMNEGDSWEGDAAMQSLVKFGKFSLPYLFSNLDTSSSGQGLSETIHALRILGVEDTAYTIGKLQAARSRIESMHSLEAKEKAQIIEDCDSTVQALQKL